MTRDELLNEVNKMVSFIKNTKKTRNMRELAVLLDIDICQLSRWKRKLGIPSLLTYLHLVEVYKKLKDNDKEFEKAYKTLTLVERERKI